jgi:hypothetical protein
MEMIKRKKYFKEITEENFTENYQPVEPRT